MKISPNKNYKNILIVKLSAIGDVIHALPVAHALKQKYPQARITWIVEKPAYDLLTNNPDIDEIILFDKPRFKSLAGLLKYSPEFSARLREHHFDLALDLQGLFKSAAIVALSNAKQRLGYCNMRELSHLVSKPVCGKHREGHVVQRYLDVARYVDCDVKKAEFILNNTTEEAANAAAIAKQAGIPTDQTYVILAPGTNWPSKCWPVERFGELAAELNRNGIISVIIGGVSDASLAATICNTCPMAIDLTGKTTLKELAFLMKGASCFVGGDTGPMHLAAAVKIPVVALFGPTSPERNGPYGDIHTIITVHEECRECWKRECPKGKQCLSAIEVKSVLEAVLPLCQAREGS
ncbi:lipopolysaccharide heptosyltransferase II [Anaerospora hongkongensis]|uniref:lipopolysaccharide heptosyltransferase II n=1 Tax=Anaerospora hongkongensis TaxID=244830 RepID=UPI0028A153BD|nr:lipopolysaccharide heptosyltransferase II [Anaerospora hongkongensis]